MQPVQSRISSQQKPWDRERNQCGKVAAIRGFFSKILKTILQAKFDLGVSELIERAHFENYKKQITLKSSFFK